VEDSFNVYALWTSNTVFLVRLQQNVVVPIIISAPVIAAEFSDVEILGASLYRKALAEETLTSGFPDGTFK